MKRLSTDLMELQKFWYEKLKKAGFKDIEDTNSPREYLKVWESTNWIKQYTPERFEDRAQYYRLAGLFYHEHHFESEKEKEVWALHCEGKALRTIAEELKKKGIKANKDNLRKILQTLIEKMKDHSFHDEESFDF